MIECLAALFVAVALGGATAWQDVREIFDTRRRARWPIWKHVPSLLFVLGNGAIAAGLVLWARLEPEGAINTLVAIEAPVGQAVVIGLGVSMLLRSKLFYIGSDGVGFDRLYLSVRDAVVANNRARFQRARDELVEEFLTPLVGREEVVGVLRQVARSSRWLGDDSERAEVDHKFEEFAELFKREPASMAHLSELVDLALDETGKIGPVERALRRCAKGKDA